MKSPFSNSDPQIARAGKILLLFELVCLAMLVATIYVFQADLVSALSPIFNTLLEYSWIPFIDSTNITTLLFFSPVLIAPLLVLLLSLEGPSPK